ncbi:MAG: TonB-dependent receptor, partial [Bdellovibrionales bacterium]|nr:TonB-dependent receptor [Bdellovibrionales bacterium]
TLDEIFFDADEDEDVQRVSSGGQYIYQADVVTSILGGQYLSINTDRREDALIYGDEPAAIFDDLDFSYQTVARSDLRSYDTYSYNVFRPVSWFTLDTGLNYSRVEYEDAEVAPFVEGSRSRNRVNPKIGLTIYPFPNLSLRAAYFESLRKSVLEDQVALEPVIVGGFTQRFNDVSGSVSRTTAVGADYKIPGESYFGVEAMERHVINPFMAITPEFNFDFSEFDVAFDSSKEEFDNHIDQDFLKAWWYQILSEDFVITSDYYYYQNKYTDPDVAQDITSHRTSLSLRYFMPGGLFAYQRSTWRQQDRVGSFFFDDGTEDFWVHDIGLGYRLPDRQGSIRLEIQNILDNDFSYDQFLGFEEGVANEVSGRLFIQFSF